MNGSSYFQLLTPLILFVFAAGFAAIHRSDRQLAAAKWMALAYATGAVGFTLDYAARDAVGPIVGSYISNVPFLCAILLISTAVHARWSDGLPWRACAMIFVGVMVPLTAVVAIDPHAFARAIVMNFGTGIAYALALPPLWRRRDGAIERVLIGLFALAVAQSFVRPIAVGMVVGFNEPAVTYSDSLYALALHLVSAIVAISLAATLFFALGMDLVRGLAERSAHDPLTGLLNRRGFREGIEGLGEDASFAVVTADIDRFKRVNDAWGHAAGDKVIVTLANILSEHAGAPDLVARFGGEEFVVVLPRANEASARLFAEACRAAFAARAIDPLPDDERCTASFGVALRSRDLSIETALRRADEALYAAKAAGRDTVMVAEEAEAVMPAPALVPSAA